LSFSALSQEVLLIKKFSNHYTLIKKDKGALDLKVEDEWLVDVTGKELPREIVLMSNLIFHIQEKKQLNLYALTDLLEKKGFEKDKAIYEIEKVCYWLFNRECLKKVAFSLFEKEVRALALAHLAMISPDLNRARSYIESALTLQPENKEIQFYAQIFGLSVAELLLTAYQEALEESMILKRLGIDPEADYESTWGKIKNGLWEATFNSLNVTRLILYADDYQEDWNDQLERISNLASAVRTLKFFLMEMYRGTINDLDRELGKNKELRDQFNQFFRTPCRNKDFYRCQYFKEIRGGKVPFKRGELPTLEDLGFKEGKYDFVDQSIWNTLAEEVNIFNILLFIKIPKITSWIGGTKAFQTFATVTRLAPAMKRLESLGKWGPRLAVLIVHTVDGQEVYAGYRIITGLTKSTWDELDLDFRALSKYEKAKLQKLK
jgi:hypothetical protein